MRRPPLGKLPPLICVDIGNTSISFGLFVKGRLGRIGRVSSNNFPLFRNKLIRFVNAYPESHLFLSSVVPYLTGKVKKMASRSGGQRVWVVGRNLKVKIRHKYRDISKLGSDRLVTAFGASRLYKPPLLILDYGTALTCDYLGPKGVFEGGLIIPGPELAFRALCEGTALLPSLRFPREKGTGSFRGTGKLLGRDTRSGMEAGILQGYGAMTDGLVRRFRRRFGRGFRVVATGGLATSIARYASSVDIVDPNLTLKSLVEAFKAKGDRLL